jgi:DNA mismatch repair ATPase MutS
LLQDLGRRMAGSGESASRALRSLDRLVGLLDSRRNQLFAPVGALLLWTTQLGLAIERWRRRHGHRIGEWVTALGEFEALAALGTYADEHPDDPMPELAEGPARFTAEGLVHPLLPRGQAVPNNLALGEGLVRALVVSGSNMSGKSTLLRAVGVNVVLAQAGAPVSAAKLRLSPLAIGASFRPQDSLQQGRSRFYAEIARLRRTVDLLEGERPVLFLLDELLSGTNSYDRALGARAIVEHLVREGAIGLVTTHDLALAGIADALAPAMANVHFEDTLEEGALHFDYRLRSGVVERSNAVELMRAVGLPV